MKEPSSANSISSSDRQLSLEEAIEQCVGMLENGTFTDRQSLIARFPQWKQELTEFLENWGGMEQYAAAFSGQHRAIDALLPAHGDTRRFGDYELQEQIGIGGMGVIYKARQISLGRIVALKMLHGERHDRERFRLEAEAAASLTHPNIVSIHETGEYQGRLFFSMQLIDGCNLREYLDQHPVCPNEAAQITETIARAVHYAHQRGILHRDLKPANVLMDVDGQPHITDFGLAKQIERDTEITRTGTIMGTPGYMAPEQADGKVKNLTTATDVYGLGAILYALLTGDAPFTGNSSLEILRRVVDEPPTSPRIRQPKIDRDLETICLKCLEKSPELRYTSAQRLADDLARFLNNEPVIARPVVATQRVWRWCRRNPATAILSIAVVALLIATTIASVFLALSERNSRLQSQENSRQKSRLNKKLSHERANLLMTNGLWQASNQNVGEALLWFSEAAQLSEEDPDKVRSNLIRCQSWLREQPLPLAAIILGQTFIGEEKADHISFQPSGRAVLNRVGRQAVVWDHERDQHWYVKESFPNLASVVWSPDGTSIVVGLDDGRVVRADIDTRQSETLFQIDESVFEVAFVNRGRWLAISSGNRVRFVDVASRELIQKEIIRQDRVRKLITNSMGTRLVVIDFSRDSSVFSVGEVELEELFSFNCHYSNVKDDQRNLWPRFVKNDQVLLARLDALKTQTLDPDSGDYLGNVALASPTYSLAIAADGESFVSGCFNYAQYYRFSKLRKKNSNGDETDPGHSDPRLSCEPNFRFPHDNVVAATAIGRDGLVATAGWNNEVRLWKTQTLTPQSHHFDVPEKAVPISVLPHQTQVRCIAFSPDGRQLLTIQIDGLVRLWMIPDVQTNGYDVAVEPGGSLVKLVDEGHWLTSGMSKWTGHMTNPIIHRVKDGSFAQGIQGLSLPEHGHLLDSDVSPNKKQLVSIHAGFRRGPNFLQGDGRGGWLRFWSLPNSKLLNDRIPMPSEPRWVTYHPRGHCVAVCTCLMEIVIVDTTTFEIKDVWETWPNARRTVRNGEVLPRNAINEQLAFSPDGKSLIAWSPRKPGLCIWDFPSGKPRFPKISNDGLAVGGFAFSPDGKKIAVAGGHNPLARVVDIETGEFICEDMKHASEVYSVEFSPDGNLLVTGCRDGYARVFDWKTGELLLKEMMHDGAVVDAAFTPDSNFIATLGHDNQLRIWNASDGSLALRPFSVPAGSAQLLISPDSRYIIVAGGLIRVADLHELQSEPRLDLIQARQISIILANKMIQDGTLVTLDSEQWLSKWQRYSRDSFSWTKATRDEVSVDR